MKVPFMFLLLWWLLLSPSRSSQAVVLYDFFFFQYLISATKQCLCATSWRAFRSWRDRVGYNDRFFVTAMDEFRASSCCRASRRRTAQRVCAPLWPSWISNPPRRPITWNTSWMRDVWAQSITNPLPYPGGPPHPSTWPLDFLMGEYLRCEPRPLVL